VLSFGLAMAGFYPANLLHYPGFDLIGSRTSMAAVFGASGALVLFFFLLSSRAVRSLREMEWLTFAACIPFIICGITSELINRYSIRDLWSRQATMWREITKIAPDLNPDSLVVVYMENYSARMGAIGQPPVIASWQMDGPLDLLYRADISGDVIFSGDVIESSADLTQQGVRQWYSGSFFPYDRVVFFRVDANSGSTKMVDNLAQIPEIRWKVAGYAPRNRILPDPPAGNYRWLIEP
jgi:hypothetical protein